MSVYQDQHRASIKMDEMIFKQMEAKAPISISALILEVTRHYPVAENFILKRLERFEQAYPDIKIKDDEVLFL